MRRKLVKQGGTTLMVSLPPAWLVKTHLKKGDEVDVFEQEEGIFVTAKGSPASMSVELTLPEGNNFVKRLLVVPYIRGADEIRAICPDALCVDKVIELVQEWLIGMEVVDTKGGICIIKNVAEARETEFNTLFRRTLLLFLDMLQEGSESFSEKNFDRLAKASKTEHILHKYTLFLQRLIHKHGYTPKHDQEVVGILLFILESSADMIRDIYKKIVSDNKLPDRKTQELLSGVLHVFDDFQTYFFKRSLDNLLRLRKTVKNTYELGEGTSFYMSNRLFCILENLTQISYLVA